MSNSYHKLCIILCTKYKFISYDDSPLRLVFITSFLWKMETGFQRLRFLMNAQLVKKHLRLVWVCEDPKSVLLTKENIQIYYPPHKCSWSQFIQTVVPGQFFYDPRDGLRNIQVPPSFHPAQFEDPPNSGRGEPSTMDSIDSLDRLSSFSCFLWHKKQTTIDSVHTYIGRGFRKMCIFLLLLNIFKIANSD